MPNHPRRGRLATFAAILTSLVTGRLRRYEIAESSMRPTLQPRDWVIASTLHRPVRPGDVVVLSHPDRRGIDLVKRISSVDSAGVIVLGDDAAAGSVDSVTFGPVPPESISARVLMRYHPLPPRLVR